MKYNDRGFSEMLIPILIPKQSIFQFDLMIGDCLVHVIVSCLDQDYVYGV